MRWAAGLGVGLGLNALMLAMLVVVPRARLRLSEPMQVTLLPRLEPVPMLRRGRAEPKRAAAAVSTGSRQAPPRTPSPSSPPAVAPAAPAKAEAAPAGPGGGDANGADIGGMLRARLGCSDPSGFRLTPEERARCLARLGQGAHEVEPMPAPIDRGKRAWFDATVAAYHSEGHLPAPVCKVYFGGPKTRFKPPHSLKLPGLPCYLIPPQGVLTEESGVAPPEHVETR